MPYFNPNKVDFNYNTNTIDAVGATGRALWDIYQDSVRNNFTKQRLAEENRSNLANEQNNIDRLNENIRHNMSTETETANNNAITQGLKRDELGLKGQELGLKANKYQNDAIYNHLMANVALQNANTNANRLNFDMQKYNNGLNSDSLETNLAFDAAGFTLPESIKDQSPQVQTRYKKAILNINNPKNGISALLGDNAGLNANIAIKKKQPTQKERDEIAGNFSLLDQLVNLKNNFTGGEQGAIQNLGHSVAKVFNMQDPKTEKFKNDLGFIRQAAKDLVGSGKISNQQYQDLMEVLPSTNSWTDTSYRVKSDSSINRLLSQITNKIQALKDSGIDTEDIEKAAAQKYKYYFNNGFFDSNFREFDADGRRIDKSKPQTPQTPQEGRSLKSERNNTQKNYVDADALGISFR
ncbi:hypothetical protein [Campylobacter concisus]|uniref:Uncharacterized protein n=1 Tax=Campylobacter concisus ATCC 51562 TaxID=1242969 RepID=U2GCT9_9BACT|nr:hypothetical protein [Campylobacter concisus]ERJ25889.1 hypothetical protein ATCC51562_1628 [Campylobacter concisus ATCC 51562]